jgi:hypothetical protein
MKDVSGRLFVGGTAVKKLLAVWDDLRARDPFDFAEGRLFPVS